MNQKQTEAFYTLTSGIDIDRFLYKEEITIQKAWVACLPDTGALTSSEAKSVMQILDRLECEIEEGLFEWQAQDEDIHMTIERVLTEHLGEIGKRIHIGRSRNDLIATTLKVYLANRCHEISVVLSRMASTVLDLSHRDIDIIVPAYTHSQAAQPVRMAHLWNFHALNFTKDTHRLRSCRQSVLEVMPLGSGAIAGTHLSIDLRKVATKLGFKSPPMNSIHAVSDRDGIIEIAQALALLGVHLIRLCEDIIFWSSTPMGLLELPLDWASGSSMMPNKRNPDFFEIARAKGKRLVSLSNEILLLNSGLPSGYASDFHEQKRVLVSALNDVQVMLPILADALPGLRIRSERASVLLQTGHLLATDVANQLVSPGRPFRDAYNQVADWILEADKRGTQVGTSLISFSTAVESRNNSGGTARRRVEDTIGWMREELSREFGT